MTTSPKQVSAGNGLDLSSLISLFGTQTNQKVSANTGPLEGLIAELSAPQDNAAQMAAIMQQIQGAIPKLGAAFGSSIGARSGNNSARQAAMQKLLADATTGAQKQFADQRQAALNTATQGAASLANTTRSVNQSQNPNYTNMGKALGALQIASKFGLTDAIKKSVLGGTAASGAADAGATGIGSSFLGNAGSYGGTQDFGLTGSLSLGENLGNTGLSGFNFGDLSSVFGAGSAAADIGGLSFDTAAGAADGGGFFSDVGDTISGGWDKVTSFFGFAEGGLVGRDGEETPVGHYADGGVVQYAGGARRSASPGYTPDPLATTSAINAVNPALARPAFNPEELLDPLFAEVSGGVTAGNPNAVAPGPASLNDVVNGVIGLGAVAAMSGIPGLSAVGSMLGITPSLSQSLQSLAMGLSGQSDNQSPPSGMPGTMGGMVGDANPADNPEGLGSTSSNAESVAASEGTGGVGGIGGGSAGAGGGSEGTGSAAGDGYAGGGKVKGPGTSTSDSVPIMASKGEYVLPADVVEALGVEFFDNLRDRFHTMTATGQAGA